MKTKYTPGPWHLNMFIVCANVSSGTVSIETPIADVCNTGAERWRDEEVANARLIAAAPELLEALQLIIGMAEDGYKLHIKNGSHQEFLSEDRDALIKANQVIKKAKGE